MRTRDREGTKWDWGAAAEDRDAGGKGLRDREPGFEPARPHNLKLLLKKAPQGAYGSSESRIFCSVSVSPKR